MAPDRIVVFTRYPRPGETKTRLIPALGAEGAAELQKSMTEHTLRRITAANSPESPLEIEVRYAGGSENEMIRWLGGAYRLVPQSDGDLGERLTAAFLDAFSLKNPGCLAVGTDCPGIGPDQIDAARRAMASGRLAIGPASDGGYYLIAIPAGIGIQATSALFRDISWGSEIVFRETMQHIEAHDLDVDVLPTLDDVDRPDDLHVWDKFRHCQ